MSRVHLAFIMTRYSEINSVTKDLQLQVYLPYFTKAKDTDSVLF